MANPLPSFDNMLAYHWYRMFTKICPLNKIISAPTISRKSVHVSARDMSGINYQLADSENNSIASPQLSLRHPGEEQIGRVGSDGNPLLSSPLQRLTTKARCAAQRTPFQGCLLSPSAVEVTRRCPYHNTNIYVHSIAVRGRAYCLKALKDTDVIYFIQFTCSTHKDIMHYLGVLFTVVNFTQKLNYYSSILFCYSIISSVIHVYLL